MAEMPTIPFDKMTEDEQDEVARARIKEILAKPKLEEGDAETVAACVAFIGTSQKMADKFSQALLDTAESLIQGLCVRCGETPGEGTSCLICESIKKVRGLKVNRGDQDPTPWTAVELTALDMNKQMSPEALAKYVPGLRSRSVEQIREKKKSLGLE